MQSIIRPYRGQDEAGLLAAWNAALTNDPITPQTFQSKVLLDPNFLPQRLLVAEADGQVAGFVLGLARRVPLYLQDLEPEQSWITAFGVHPDFQRRAVGTALFKSLLETLKNEGRKVVRISPYVPNYFTPGVDREAYPAALEFLAKLGFSMIEEPVSMHMDLTRFRTPPEVAAHQQVLARTQGITVRPLESADLPDLMPFIAEHFSWEWWRHAQEYLLEQLAAVPDQVAFWIARRGEEVLGYCQMRRERFGPFGVRPNLRNLGIGQVLLCRCLEEMRARGFHAAWFLWAEPEVQRLYLRSGFRVARRWVIFEKEL